MAPRAAVVDLDGTLLHGDTLLPGARDAMAAIRERVEHVVFLTNNPTIPPEAYAARLRDLGVEAAPDEILTACTATIAYLRAHHADDAVFAIAADAIVDQLRDAERDLVADPAAAECVVVGYDPGFDYDDLHAALRALRDGVGFVGTDPDRTIPTPTDRSRGRGRSSTPSRASLNATPTRSSANPRGRPPNSSSTASASPPNSAC